MQYTGGQRKFITEEPLPGAPALLVREPAPVVRVPVPAVVLPVQVLLPEFPAGAFLLSVRVLQASR